MKKGETPEEFGQRMAAARAAKKAPAMPRAFDDEAPVAEPAEAELDDEAGMAEAEGSGTPAPRVKVTPKSEPAVKAPKAEKPAEAETSAPGACRRHHWGDVKNVRETGRSKNGGAVYELRDQTCQKCGLHQPDGKWSRTLKAEPAAQKAVA